jgi:hypothetical protein
MTLMRRTMLLAFALLTTLACGSLVARASAQALSDEAGAEWRLEQPNPPVPPSGVEPATVPIGLGSVGDIEFWAPNRGALITAGNGSTVPAGVWVYDGACEGAGASGSCASGWHELATQCGASDPAASSANRLGRGRIVWTGPDEFWTISDGRPGQAVSSNGTLPPLEDDTLCRFALNKEEGSPKYGEFEIANSYASLAFQSNSYQAMDAAACIDSSDCWFGGEELPPPQVGTFQLHWNGHTLTQEPYLPEGHRDGDMATFEGRVFQSLRLVPGDPIVKKEGHVGELPALHVINPEGASPGFEVVHELPLLAPGEFPEALDFLRLSADEPRSDEQLYPLAAEPGDALWAAAGPREAPSGSSTAGVTILRYSARQYSAQAGEYVEAGAPSWTEVVGPCPTLAGECESKPPHDNPFPNDVVNSVAAEPATNSAWVALDSEEDAIQPSPTAVASVARVSAEGTISDELQLPSSADQHSPKGAAERIVCPGEHDCWMVTNQGWLFHLSTEVERDAPEPNTDTAFSGGYLITQRPPDEGVPQETPDTLPEEGAAPEVTKSSGTGLVKVAPTEQFALVDVPLLSHVRTRLVHGTTLELSFHLSVKAKVRLLAKRKTRVVASTAMRTFAAGNRNLLLQLNVHRWPTKLDLQTHALAPLKTVSTRESSAETDLVSSSLAFPGARGLQQSGLLGSGPLR